MSEEIHFERITQTAITVTKEAKEHIQTVFDKLASKTNDFFKQFKNIGNELHETLTVQSLCNVIPARRPSCTNESYNFKGPDTESMSQSVRESIDSSHESSTSEYDSTGDDEPVQGPARPTYADIMRQREAEEREEYGNVFDAIDEIENEELDKNWAGNEASKANIIKKEQDIKEKNFNEKVESLGKDFHAFFVNEDPIEAQKLGILIKEKLGDKELESAIFNKHPTLSNEFEKKFNKVDAEAKEALFEKKVADYREKLAVFLKNEDPFEAFKQGKSINKELKNDHAVRDAILEKFPELPVIFAKKLNNDVEKIQNAQFEKFSELAKNDPSGAVNYANSRGMPDNPDRPLAFKIEYSNAALSMKKGEYDNLKADNLRNPTPEKKAAILEKENEIKQLNINHLKLELEGLETGIDSKKMELEALKADTFKNPSAAKRAILTKKEEEIRQLEMRYNNDVLRLKGMS
jgi:hypothetical protein